MSLEQRALSAQRASHQIRHRLRTRFEERIPRRLDDGSYSPAGTPATGVAECIDLVDVGVRRLDVAHARRATALVCDAGSPSGRLAVLGGSGALLVGDGDGPQGRDELSALVRATTTGAVAEPSAREILGVEIRRRAWRSLRRRRPSLSVLLATARPAEAPHAAQQLARQLNVDFQLVVGLHGSAWTSEHAAPFRELGDDIVVLHVDEAVPLGSVLSLLSHTADGDVVTKWDDDDFYGPHHLEDLQSALAYSGAELVGRGSDFVYLQAADVTVRRRGRSESFDRAVAGGTLMIRSEHLAEVGGWGDLARHVDLDLIDRVHRGGGWTYRTHPFGYLLRRSASDTSAHTWSVSDRYFEDAAIERRPGAAFEFAGIVE